MIVIVGFVCLLENYIENTEVNTTWTTTTWKWLAAALCVQLQYDTHELVINGFAERASLDLNGA